MRSHRPVRAWLGLLVAGCLLSAPLGASRAQEPSSPAPPPAAASVEQLAERLLRMEEANRKLSEELERIRREHGAQMKQILDRVAELSPAAGPSPPPAPAPPADRRPPGAADAAAETVTRADGDTPVPDYTEGQFGPYTTPPGVTKPPTPAGGRSPLLGSFGPGFQWVTEDEEFRLRVHLESQFEARVWGQGDQVPPNSGIFLPRQRIFFEGNITKPIEYEFSINRGFGTLNLLNAYLNLHIDDRFQVKFGRFFTPMLYDQFAVSNYWLPTPERSVFTTNLSLNRQFGLMGWGYLLDKRLDYAAGVFNGSRNSFEPVGRGMDFVGYLNARPFQESSTLEFLRFLNVGTSVAFGHQDQAPVPVSFRIGGGSPSADVPGPGTVPFLILNRDVVERGERLIGSVHAAYFLRGLSLLGEWQYGYGGYASASRPRSERVPFSGFYVAGGYFLTGEHVERRARVKPLRPLFPTSPGDRRGAGAWEVAGRVGALRVGDSVFTSGFADPGLWSGSAVTTELGVNWYWNEYIKLYMFWLHGDFGDPVQYRPGGFQKTADMFWMRFQLYF